MSPSVQGAHRVVRVDAAVVRRLAFDCVRVFSCSQRRLSFCFCGSCLSLFVLFLSWFSVLFFGRDFALYVVLVPHLFFLGG